MKVLLAVSLLLVPGPAALAQTTFTYIVFDPPNSTKTYATQINDSGAALGYYLDATTQLYTGFIRKADDTFSLNLDLSNSNTYTTGINDSGEISGYYFPPDTETTFLLKAANTRRLTTLAPSPHRSTRLIEMETWAVSTSPVQRPTLVSSTSRPTTVSPP